MIPTPTGRARARSARARAPPRLYSLAGLRLTMLLLLSPCCSSRCSCSGLSSFPMLWRLFFGLQSPTLPCLSRFPFHDSQVSVLGSKIDRKFSFLLDSLLDRFGGPKMERKTLQNRAPELPKTLSEHVSCRTLFPHSVSMLSGPPGTSEIVLPCTREHDF